MRRAAPRARQWARAESSASWTTSGIQTGCASAQTRPGRPMPRAKVACRLAASKSGKLTDGAVQISTHRKAAASRSIIHSAPCSQPSDSQIARRISARPRQTSRHRPAHARRRAPPSVGGYRSLLPIEGHRLPSPYSRVFIGGLFDRASAPHRQPPLHRRGHQLRGVLLDEMPGARES